MKPDKEQQKWQDAALQPNTFTLAITFMLKFFRFG